MKIAILGYGKEGRAALTFLRGRKEYRDARFEIRDRARSSEYLGDLQKFDLVIKSPGVPTRLPEIQKALKKGVKFSSATELFFQHKKGLVVGITGTKGKGTTATLLYRMLKRAGKDIYLAGNIGVPAVHLIGKLKRNSITVLELSSFQLQNLGHSPEVAVILGVAPDHLDVHTNFKEYVDAKSCMARHQTKTDSIFYLPYNPYSKKIAHLSKGRKISVDPKHFSLFSLHELKLPWPHIYEDAVMAASVAQSLGVSEKDIRAVARGFRGMRQRMELRGVWDGIHVYNDSGSANPHAAAAAVSSMHMPTVLIVGGKDRGVPLDDLGRAVAVSSVRAVVCYGENKRKMAQALATKYILIRTATDLDEAVREAFAYAKKAWRGGQEWAILFSPGSASFDMFKDSYARGDAFNAIVKRYTK